MSKSIVFLHKKDRAPMASEILRSDDSALMAAAEAVRLPDVNPGDTLVVEMGPHLFVYPVEATEIKTTLPAKGIRTSRSHLRATVAI